MLPLLFFVLHDGSDHLAQFGPCIVEAPFHHAEHGVGGHRTEQDAQVVVDQITFPAEPAPQIGGQLEEVPDGPA